MAAGILLAGGRCRYIFDLDYGRLFSRGGNLMMENAPLVFGVIFTCGLSIYSCPWFGRNLEEIYGRKIRDLFGFDSHSVRTYRVP